MALRRRSKRGNSGPHQADSRLGSRVAELLRLAEEERNEIVTKAHPEAARIVDEDAKRLRKSWRTQGYERAG